MTVESQAEAWTPGAPAPARRYPQGLIEVVVVYKVDRLTRSLADFAKMVELFDARHVSFVAVTQHFNTTTSMGRLTLNVLLLSPSSNGRSQESASATKSPPPGARAFGWAGWSLWGTKPASDA